MNDSPCPSLSDLELDASGNADESLRRHIAGCPRCRRRVGEIRENNALLREVAGLAPDRPSRSDEPGGDGPEGYRILDEIRRGGQGTVFRAVQIATNRVVALKVLHAGALATSRQRRRFEREIEIVAGLRHPNIVTVYDSGVTGAGDHYFAMEYVEGTTLDRYAAARAAELTPGRARTDFILRLFSRVCDAVNAAHQRGVIHRDLKPANILVDVSGEPKVLDFGLAKVADADERLAALDVTRAGEFMGTLAYAAPEQVGGDPHEVDVRTDVHALGVILYELLTGRMPYGLGDGLRDAVHAVTNTPAAPCRAPRTDAGATVDAELETIVLKALAKEKARRYQSAEALRDDLERYLTGRPIDARRDSGWYVLRKTLARYKWPTAAAALFVAVLAVFGVTSSVLYGRASMEAEKLRQINLFWEDTLASVEPARAGREATVGELLDEAEPWVAIAFPHEPEIEATVRSTLGNSYRALGRFDEARLQLSTALETRRRLFGERSAAVAQSLNGLGLLARAEGRLDDSERLASEALDLRRSLLGPDHPDVATALQNLAATRRDRGDLAGAESVMREALAIREKHLGPGHQDTAMVVYQLARLKERAGDDAAAEPLHRRALATRRAVLPIGHPDLPRSLADLGALLVRLNRAAEAEPLLRECLELQLKRFPPDDWRAAAAAGGLGACLRALGRSDEAEPLLMDALEILRDRLGLADPRTREVLSQAAALYEQTGRPDRAAELRALPGTR